MTATLIGEAVTVHGDPVITAALEGLLAGCGGIEVAVALDAPDWRDLNRRALAAGPALVPVRRVHGAVEVGPVVQRGRSGCLECAHHRGEGAARAGSGAVRARARRLAQDPPVRRGALARPVLEVVASLVADEIAAVRADATPRTRESVLRIGTADLTVTRHPFHSCPTCPACGSLPMDEPRAARIRLDSQPKRAATDLRLRSLQTDRLLELYVDERTGVIAGIDLDVTGGALMGAARIAPLCTEGIAGYGRSLDRSSAVAVAILEGLERRAGLEPGGKRTAVRSSYADLGPDVAVDPTGLGLPTFDPDPGTRFTAFQPDTVVNWVYGHSFARDKPVLVPEAYAYYGVHGETLFAFECSNGCALGATVEEAIVHGILEVAERDAFLLTWYARLPVRRIDPHTADDATIRLLVDRVERETGLAVHAYDTTMPEGVPSWWVMFVDEHDRPDWPKALCSAAAGLDPEAALRSALIECYTAIDGLRREVARPEVMARATAMLHADELVTAMADHSLLYALPQAWPRLGFLHENQEMWSVAQAFPKAGRYVPAADLADDLRYLIDRYLGAGYDVIAVDQTTPELLRADLRCVKVIIPGLLPMTFGHRNRRAEKLPRLRTVPVLLGHRSEPLRDEEVNPHPHPFP